MRSALELGSWIVDPRAVGETRAPWGGAVGVRRGAPLPWGLAGEAALALAVVIFVARPRWIVPHAVGVAPIAVVQRLVAESLASEVVLAARVELVGCALRRVSGAVETETWREGDRLRRAPVMAALAAGMLGGGRLQRISGAAATVLPAGTGPVGTSLLRVPGAARTTLPGSSVLGGRLLQGVAGGAVLGSRLLQDVAGARAA